MEIIFFAHFYPIFFEINARIRQKMPENL